MRMFDFGFESPCRSDMPRGWAQRSRKARLMALETISHRDPKGALDGGDAWANLIEVAIERTPPQQVPHRFPVRCRLHPAKRLRHRQAMGHRRSDISAIPVATEILEQRVIAD